MMNKFKTAILIFFMSTVLFSTHGFPTASKTIPLENVFAKGYPDRAIDSVEFDPESSSQQKGVISTHRAYNIYKSTYTETGRINRLFCGIIKASSTGEEPLCMEAELSPCVIYQNIDKGFNAFPGWFVSEVKNISSDETEAQYLYTYVTDSLSEPYLLKSPYKTKESDHIVDLELVLPEDGKEKTLSAFLNMHNSSFGKIGYIAPNVLDMKGYARQIKFDYEKMGPAALTFKSVHLDEPRKEKMAEVHLMSFPPPEEVFHDEGSKLVVTLQPVIKKETNLKSVERNMIIYFTDEGQYSDSNKPFQVFPFCLSYGLFKPFSETMYPESERLQVKNVNFKHEIKRVMSTGWQAGKIEKGKTGFALSIIPSKLESIKLHLIRELPVNGNVELFIISDPDKDKFLEEIQNMSQYFFDSKWEGEEKYYDLPPVNLVVKKNEFLSSGSRNGWWRYKLTIEYYDDFLGRINTQTLGWIEAYSTI